MGRGMVFVWLRGDWYKVESFLCREFDVDFCFGLFLLDWKNLRGGFVLGGKLNKWRRSSKSEPAKSF